MSLSTRAVTTTVLSAAVAVAAYVGVVPLLGVIVVLVVLLALGWAPLIDGPSPVGSTLVIVVAGLGGAAVAWRAEGEPVLRSLPLVVAMAMVLAFLAEMARRDGRPRLVESLTGTVAGSFVAVAASGWVATVRSVGGPSLVTTTAVALAAAAFVSAVAIARGWVGALIVVAVAAGAGAATGAAVAGVEPRTGLVTGVSAGLGVVVVRVLLERVPQVRLVRAGLAAAVVPVAVGGMLAFAVGRVLLG